MARKPQFDEDSVLRKPNAHERKNESKKYRKQTRRALTDYTCLEDALEDEDYLYDDYDQY